MDMELKEIARVVRSAYKEEFQSMFDRIAANFFWQPGSRPYVTEKRLFLTAIARRSFQDPLEDLVDGIQIIGEDILNAASASTQSAPLVGASATSGPVLNTRPDSLSSSIAISAAASAMPTGRRSTGDSEGERIHHVEVVMR
jgi:hypothetical protein